MMSNLTWRLEQNKISCRDDCLKTELAEIIKKIAPEPLYKIDEIAKSFGHEVLRTPPYHPELQPIEICWGVVKNHIARNCDFTMTNLVKQLDNGFEKVQNSLPLGRVVDALMMFMPPTIAPDFVHNLQISAGIFHLCLI